MENTDQSTQPKFKEQWIVAVDKERHLLTGEQMETLKGEILAGNRGLVMFKDLAIVISHISSFWLDSRQIANQLTAGEKDYTLTQEQRAKARVKIAQIRKERFGENQVA